MHRSLLLVIFAVTWRLCTSQDDAFPKEQNLVVFSKVSSIVLFSLAGLVVICALVLTQTHWQHYIPDASTMQQCCGRSIPTVHVARLAGMFKFLLFDTPDLITSFWFVWFCILAKLDIWLMTILAGVSVLLGVISWVMMACSLVIPEQLCADYLLRQKASNRDDGIESSEDDEDDTTCCQKCWRYCCNLLKFWHLERKQFIYRGTLVGLLSDMLGIFVFFMVENFDPQAETMPLWLKATEAIVSLMAAIAEMAQGAGEFFADEEKNEEWLELEQQNELLKQAELAGCAGVNRGADETLRDIQTDLQQLGRSRRELLLVHKAGPVHDFLMKDEEVVTMLEKMVEKRNKVIRKQRQQMKRTQANGSRPAVPGKGGNPATKKTTRSIVEADVEVNTQDLQVMQPLLPQQFVQEQAMGTAALLSLSTHQAAAGLQKQTAVASFPAQLPVPLRPGFTSGSAGYCTLTVHKS